MLQIRELMATDPAAHAAIWNDLLSRDLVSEVRAVSWPVDEPLLCLLADRRRARPRLFDGLWVRLVSVPQALRASAVLMPLRRGHRGGRRPVRRERGALARAGLAEQARPGAIAALATALSWEPAPWSPTIF